MVGRLADSKSPASLGFKLLASSSLVGAAAEGVGSGLEPSRKRRGLWIGREI